MQADNVGVMKNKLRGICIDTRKKMSAEKKLLFDNDIFLRIIASEQYSVSKTLITYISKDIEVDTVRLIYKALSDGKRVAVPKCLNKTGDMDFYVIKSLDMLEKGCFGVYEPKTNVCEKLSDYSESMSIVPGLSFDGSGCRLGYGKGYYDRFLSVYDGVSAGICYSNCMVSRVPKDRYDVPVDFVITECCTIVPDKNKQVLQTSVHR